MSAAVVMAAAGVTALVMVSAGMPLTVVVVAAYGVGIVGQAASQQGLHLGVRTAGRTGVELNPRLSQGAAGAAADAAADQRIYIMLHKEAGKRAVTASVGGNYFGTCYSAIFHRVKFKLLCVSEVLKHFSIFISDRNFHNNLSFLMS